MVDVVASVSEINAEWLTEALGSQGLLDGRVASVALEPIGAGVGLMGELARLRLTYEGESHAPEIMIAKCAAQSENRAVAQLLDFYNREVNFYNNVGADCLLTVPDSYYGAVNQDTYDCVLLMEDLGDVSPRDQVVGASEDEVFVSIERVAAMHAKYWGKTLDAENAWMYSVMAPEESVKLGDGLYVPSMEAAMENFKYLMTDEREALIRAVGSRYVEFWTEGLGDVDTFIHGDYRQDNFIYPDNSLEATVMDWQISGRGKGIFDVTYFMCQSVTSEVRAKIEREIIQKYVDDLAAGGVSDYPFELAWEHYRRVIMGCLVYPMTVCGTLDLANERGKALAECMMQRNLQAIEDLNCVELL